MNFFNSKLVILSGPSGVGKDSVLRRWSEINPKVKRVPGVTTRLPRPGEIETDEYEFISADEFERRRLDHGFLEFQPVFDYFYATPVKKTSEILQQGNWAILKIDVEGTYEIMDHLERLNWLIPSAYKGKENIQPKLISIFLMPKELEILKTRLENRGTETEEQIEGRLQRANKEIKMSERYDFRVINDDLEKTVREVDRIVRESSS